jgi:modulator of FtsH protease HflK
MSLPEIPDHILTSDNDQPPRKKNPWGNPEPPPRTPWGYGGGQGGGQGGGGNTPDMDDMIRKAQESFKSLLPGGTPPSKLLLLGLAGLLVLWFASGFYLVQPNENGVVLTFGKYTRTEETAGLKFHVPWPVQSVTIVDVTQERRIQIGFTDRTSQTASRAATDNIDESLMLTGDENIIDIDFVVLWRVGNARDFLFSVRNPEDTIQLVASSAMREIIGQTPIQSALTEGRTKIQTDTRALMQKILDDYKTGVTINNVQLQKVDPPQDVVDAFNEVQRARQDQERAKNQAEAYRNSIIPVAKGEAEKLRQEAQAYKEQIVNRATGDAARFESVLTAYRSGERVTADRMYLETIEDVLTNARTVVIGSSPGSNIMPYLPIDNLMRAKPIAQPEAGAAQPDAAATLIAPPQQSTPRQTLR